MMANPAEYRDTLWMVLHDGKISPEMQAKIDAHKAEDIHDSIGKPTPASAFAEYEAMLARAAELQAEQSANPPTPGS